MKTRRFLLAAGVLLVMAFMVSCVGDDSSAFVGKWITEDGSSAPFGLPDNLELFKDGTGVIEGRSISWKVEDKRFVISSSLKGFASAFDYEISGRILTLIDDKRERERYFKHQEGKIEGKTLTDNRDGKKYKTVIIGVQTWMAENLNYNTEDSKCYGEGGKIIIDVDDKGKPTATKTLSDKEIRQMCENYGRLYDWTTAKKACPSGWHLPSENEWDVLWRIVGGKVAGKKLKAKSGWGLYENGNGTDEYGFSALPGGGGNSNGYFSLVGSGGYWWSTNESNSNDAYRRNMSYSHDNVYWSIVYKSYLFSVRCLQD